MSWLMDEDLDIETAEGAVLAEALAKRVGAKSAMVCKKDGWEHWIIGKDRAEWFDNGKLVESVMTFKVDGIMLSCKANKGLDLHDPDSIGKFERMHRHCVEHDTCKDCPHAY
jgi:hypothetical protein